MTSLTLTIVTVCLFVGVHGWGEDNEQYHYYMDPYGQYPSGHSYGHFGRDGQQGPRGDGQMRGVERPGMRGPERPGMRGAERPGMRGAEIPGMRSVERPGRRDEGLTHKSPHAYDSNIDHPHRPLYGKGGHQGSVLPTREGNSDAGGPGRGGAGRPGRGGARRPGQGGAEGAEGRSGQGPVVQPGRGGPRGSGGSRGAGSAGGAGKAGPTQTQPPVPKLPQPEVYVNPQDAVASSVVRTTDQYFYKPSPVGFDNVITNINGGYNPEYGVFTAPVPGIYSVNYHVQTKKGSTKVAHVDLTQNGELVNSAKAKGDCVTASNSAVLYLDQFDRLSVNGRQGTVIGCENNGFCSFSVTLVKPGKFYDQKVARDVPMGKW